MWLSDEGMLSRPTLAWRKTLCGLGERKKKVKYRKAAMSINPAEKFNLETMTLEELWSLRETVRGILSAEIKAKKRKLEKRLSILNR